MLSIGDVEVHLDESAIAALNFAEGIVGRATMRAGEVAAGRVRNLIQSYDLIDTGAMLEDVQAQLRQNDRDGVTVAVGTPNVEHTLYQREPFLLEALAETTPADFDE